MANFFTDNEDIKFLFDHTGIADLAVIMEDGFKYYDEFDYAPEDADDAVDNYRRILETLGGIAGDIVEPTAEETDLVGNILNDDNTVTYAPGIRNAIDRLAEAELMGFTLPYRFGGINCPQLLYVMSIEMISRADASLMNLYGLQGIAETINAFASEEIKQMYLPDMASGKKTGAMVLTEPDAGSDLQAVKVKGTMRVYKDDEGNWFVSGVKRFITNGCGDVLLVLVRTEEGTTDGRGLSLFVVDSGPRVKVRRLENKLGIHGSPTCELFFDDAPALLVGERQRGLVTYVMSLMNGARIGIAAQSLGIGEAAYRVARNYAHSRKQFNTEIENLPAVRELLVNMSVEVQAARALTYYSSYCVDVEFGALKKMESGKLEGDDKKDVRKVSRKYKRMNAMLTPMSKYFASEMSIMVSNDSVTVLGGSGYMKDYPVERHLRDSRITNIYEGTSQLQIVAAVRGVCSGTAEMVIGELLDRDCPQELADMVERIREGAAELIEAVTFTKEQGGSQYMDLYGRKLVDMAITLIVGALFCSHARENEKKKVVAKYWLDKRLPQLRIDKEAVCSGDTAIMDEFMALAGDVPELD